MIICPKPQNINKLPMRTLNYILSGLILTGMIFASGCGNDDDVITITPAEERTELLSSLTWNFKTVSQDGVDISSAFTGATLTFTATGTFSTNVDPTYALIFPASGSWSIPDETQINQIMFNNIPMTISDATATSLTLNFSFVGASANKGGRINSLDGAYVVTFTR